MITYWAAIRAFVAAQVLVLLAISFTVTLLLADRYLRTLIRVHWKIICLAVLIVAVWRFPFRGTAFYGLEYEDSYVYTVAARAPALQQEFPVPGAAYLTKACTVGSLESCEVVEVFSGHYIGWPSIITISLWLFHYTPLLPVYLNIVGSCVAAIAIFLICCLTTGESAIGVAATFVFATTPAFAVHGVAAYAEPASNTCIAAVLLCFLRYLHEEDSDRSVLLLLVNWLAFVFTALLAVLIKRENLLLVGVLLLAVLAYMVYRAGALGAYDKRLYTAVGGIVIVIMLCATEFALVKSLASEAREFGGFPFSLANLRTFAPAYLRAFVSLRWYMCSIVFVIVGLWVTCRRKTALALVSCVFLCYVFLYASHVESYYQSHSGSVFPYETLRYSMNLMTLWSIVGGVGLVELTKHRRTAASHRIEVWALALMYAAASYVCAANLRRADHADETGSRIVPALIAAKAAAQSSVTPTYVVTLEPLVLQMFASESTRVLGLYALDDHVFEWLRREHATFNIIYLRQSQYSNDISNERYARSLECLSSLPQRILYEDKEYSVATAILPKGECSRAK